MINWKTSLFGALSAIFGFIATTMPDLKEVLAAASALCLALMAMFAKDATNTGTTKL